ncbi:3-acetyltrichothecene 15-o-acetyltransferase [Fusarium longipes]|uniref:3-acetyltrichothecene 15-o-acetyltransferase n=1 Tax=Fusarium longipes TaxID=694270 RepID=A0A395SL28_9HYPO|nr:3-acetyltrichothecene 15-o-acetyltransferase [Fusarium longipes]
MSGPSSSTLPLLVPELYRWKSTGPNNRQIQRRAVGAEAIVGLKDKNKKALYDLYIAASLRNVAPTSKSLTLQKLKEMFEMALLDARFEHPECACTVSWDDEVPAIITYESPESQESARFWARDCVHIRPTSKSALDLWGKLEQERAATNDSMPSKSIEIFLLSDVLDNHTPIPHGTAVEVLVHSNHLFWDGIGCRKFVGDVFRLLGNYIGVTASSRVNELQWGHEIQNLNPPIVDSLKLNVRTLGTEFDDKCTEYTNALVANYKSRGLKFRPGLGLPRCVIHKFSAADSIAIVAAVKSRLGPGFTISHLAQAAIVLALLDHLKPTDLSDEQVFISPTSVDGRRWLHDDIASNFYAMCQTAAVVRVEKLKTIAVSHKDEKDKQVRALESACKDVKRSYDQWLGNPFLQALGIRVHNFEANYLHAKPVPFDGEANPLFISDGINERFIPREIKQTVTGENVLSVESIDFVVNQSLPYLAIRLDSWRDASTLNIIFNDANYSESEVQKYLESIVEFMLAFQL